MLEKQLKNGWRIALDPQNAGKDKGWHQTIAEGTIEPFVPGLIQDNFDRFHTGTAWYWNEFTVDAIPENTDCFLKLGNTEGVVDFWMNGQYLGREIRKEIYYKLECTNSIRQGKNLLAIRIVVPHENEEFEGYRYAEMPIVYMHSTGLPFGGIRYPVEITFRPTRRIDRAVVRADSHSGKVEIDVQLHNAQAASLSAKILSASGEIVAQQLLDPTEDAVSLSLFVAEHRLWDHKEPYLYTLQLDLLENNHSLHSHSVRFGFREFVVKDGWFQLNGKRILLRSSYLMDGWHTMGALLTNEMLYKELCHLKSLGFNSLRYHNTTGRPEVLDMCDQMGILVIEAHGGSWILKKENRYLKETFQSHISYTVHKDLNHACIVAWELVNETHFEHEVAVATLPLVREIDMTRLVFLSSGRWDNDMRIGSVSNPGSTQWECVWGAEDPNAEPPTQMVKTILSTPELGEWTWKEDDLCCWQPYLGDVHIYPRVPMTFRGKYALRYHAKGLKPAFVSEVGSASFGDSLSLCRRYEQEDKIPVDERTRMCFECGKFIDQQWNKYELWDTFSFPEDMVQEANKQNARTRIAQMELMRANPQVNGYCFSCLSSTNSGFGVLNWFREKRPFVAEAVSECNAPLRWCTFVEPGHIYAGENFTVEAVLASEDVLRPGKYPVCARIHSMHSGRVWEYHTDLVINDPGDGYLPLSFPVFKETIQLNEPGEYTFRVYLEHGGAATGGNTTFYVSKRPDGTGKKVSVIGLEDSACDYLRTLGVEIGETGTILVGDMPDEETVWDALYKRIEAGATAVFLKPEAFLPNVAEPYSYVERNIPKRLRLSQPGVLHFTDSWAYRVHTIMKKHTYSDGLHLGILNDTIYNQVEPIYIYEDIQKPDEIVSVTINSPYVDKSSDEIHDIGVSGVAIGIYNYGKGKIVLNTFRILDELGNNPAADKLLLNFL